MVNAEEAIFRSAEMSLVQFYVPMEVARDTAYTLGQLGLVQFRDLNSRKQAFQRAYVDDIRRLENVERVYRYLYSLLQKHNIQLYEADEADDTEGLETMVLQEVPSGSHIDDHVQNATFLEERLKEMEDASDQIKRQRTDLEQYRFLLKSGDVFFSESDVATDSVDDEMAVANSDAFPRSGSVNYVTGAIPSEKTHILEQILWRTLRGNLLFKHISINKPLYDEKSGKRVNKDAFIVFSHGDLIMERIRKVAESLDAKLYYIDPRADARSEKLAQINRDLEDLNTIMQTSNMTLESELFAVSKELNAWFQEIAKEKSVFETLNKFNNDKNRKTLIAEGWIPSDQIILLRSKLEEMVNRLGIDFPSTLQILETTSTPPTYHRTNKFTEAFQAICDCYGIPEYREVNPGLPTIVTFPFMFAVMFGDLGHGSIMFLAALALVLNEKTLGKMKRDEIFDMAYTGRYVLLLMGTFSMYTGFLYNDIFSKSMTFFKSGWKWPENFKAGDSVSAESVSTYPIGLDWAWHGAENNLLFTNSYKMKLSILMGIIHMSYSYMFSLVNHIHFHSMIDIIGNFIPGLLFMQGIFGYLSICIVYKWTVDWIKDERPAPSLLNMLINMFLAPGQIDEELYPHQAKVQVTLLVIALICVPWLLFVKPLHFKFTHKENIERRVSLSGEAAIERERLLPDLEDGLEEVEEEEHLADETEAESHESEGENFGDVMIHQVIHTIEFCLNCVSHTASYLRLWALSLAHAQLSSVLWSMTLELSFGMSGALGVFAIVFLFGMWFVLTVCVLVVMEGTSAMLHSLRLHWVESMSKFFVGDGNPYEPFEFKNRDLIDESIEAGVISTKESDPEDHAEGFLIIEDEN
ncbi:V-type proton ATPase subunit a, vacuolar isoform [Nakaseomyces bracarensis]|uniref:V-type proton ATPase subunit a n=1 Tax=Nakaseomyces bracarensis TaxID=273131 RepID=A0ABR4NSI8_9SACH